MMTRLSTLGTAGAFAVAIALAACASAGGPAGSGGRRSSCPLRGQDSLFLAGGPVYRECAVDRQASLLTQLHPEFRVEPSQRCYAAEVEFVVGPTGLPETETSRVVRPKRRALFARRIATSPTR